MNRTEVDNLLGNYIRLHALAREVAGVVHALRIGATHQLVDANASVYFDFEKAKVFVQWRRRVKRYGLVDDAVEFPLEYLWSDYAALETGRIRQEKEAEEKERRDREEKSREVREKTERALLRELKRKYPDDNDSTHPAYK
jgi:hypothetical protein